MEDDYPLQSMGLGSDLFTDRATFGLAWHFG